MSGLMLRNIGVALFIGLGFTAVGRLLLAPKYSGLFAWNDSFLVGAGVCAGALFPLSVVFPHSALRIIWTALVVSLAALAFVLLKRRTSPGSIAKSDESSTPRSGRIGSIGVIVLVLIAVSSLCFAISNAQWRYSWDGFLIWATKGQVLYFEGGLSPEPKLSLDAEYLGRNATYPPLVPLYEALMWKTYGKFDFDISKALFLIFYLSLLLSTYRMARALTTVRLGLVAAALVSWLPAVSTGESIGGYADMPFACFLAAAAANLVDGSADSGWRSAAPWLMGSLLMVKDEGILVVTIACAVVFLTWLSLPLHRVWKRIDENWKAIAIILLFALLRVGYLRWLSYVDGTYRPINWPNAVRAMSVFGTVARLCAAHFVSFQQFGFLWPTFVLFGGILLVKGSAKERALVSGTIVAVLAYTSPFLFTTWDIAAQVSTAYDRLLSQLAPLASVCIVVGYHLARSALRPSEMPRRKEAAGIENALA